MRTPEEFAAGAVPGFVHAPGGQLVQATDQWIGTRGARVVLVDDEEVRAPMTAQWLRQLGHEAYVLAGGVAAAAPLAGLRRRRPRCRLPDPDPDRAGRAGRSACATAASVSSICARA